MPRRQQRPGWLWSRRTSGSKGHIGGEVAAGAGSDTPVSSAEGPPDDQEVTTTKLAPGDPPKDYWVYGNRILTVRETPEDEG